MSLIRFLSVLAVTAALIGSAGKARAQAWVPVKGSLGLSMDYTYGPSDRIVETEGIEFGGPGLATANHTVAISSEFTPIENLSIVALVPIVTTHHPQQDPVDGEEPLFPPHGRYDDGDYHTVAQDLRVTVRYNVLPNDPVAITPHIGVSTPMSNYETVGYAGAGRGLNQLHMGLSVGRYFTSGPLQNFYVHLLYEFSLVERYKTIFPETEDYGQNRSDFKAIVGYFITDDLEVNVGADYRMAHGGFNFIDYQDVPVWVQDHHDALLAESFLLLGGGVTYEISEGFRFNFVGRYWTSGKNTRDTHIVGAGFAWDIL